MAEVKGLDLSTKIDSHVAHINGDKRRTEQILLNLLSNAVKFTEKGSVQLICKESNGMIEIHVKDTGIGIAEKDIEKLFEPFSQVDTGLTRKYVGTGLGLSICKKLLEIMDGSVIVKSSLGLGSTFIVKFPINQERKNDL
jgi:signal transduction histidine kinase